MGGEPHGVEGADQVDVDHPDEILERLRPVAADDALGRTDAGTIDENARRPLLVARLRNGGRGLVGVRDVAADGDGADLRRRLPRGVDIDVEDRDLGAGRCELHRGRAAEAGAAAGHERCVSSGMHGISSELRAEGELRIATYYAVPAPARKRSSAHARRRRRGPVRRAGRHLTRPKLIRK